MGEMKELFHIRLDGAAILGYCEEFIWVRGNAVHLLFLVRSSVTYAARHRGKWKHLYVYWTGWALLSDAVETWGE